MLFVMDRESCPLPTPSLSGHAPGIASGTGDLFITKDAGLGDRFMGDSGMGDRFIITDSGTRDRFIIFLKLVEGEALHSSLIIDADVEVEQERHMIERKMKIMS